MSPIPDLGRPAREPHPIQQEMLRIEAGFEKDAPPPGPPIDQCIGKMIEFDGDVAAELDPILEDEVERCGRLLQGHYSEFTRVTPRNLIAIGFLQGVTFMRAAENLRQRAEQEPDE